MVIGLNLIVGMKFRSETVFSQIAQYQLDFLPIKFT